MLGAVLNVVHANADQLLDTINGGLELDRLGDAELAAVDDFRGRNQAGGAHAREGQGVRSKPGRGEIDHLAAYGYSG